MATVRYAICSASDWGTPTWAGQADQTARDALYDGNYASVTAWEAASYGATASDDAIGEVYGIITESSTVTLNDTTPLSITLTAVTGAEHDGTPGSGAEISLTPASANNGLTNDVGATISWLEIDGNSNAIRYLLDCDVVGATIHNCIIHSTSGMTALSALIILSGSVTHTYHNNLIYDITVTSGADALGVYAVAPESICYNNTITDITTNSPDVGDDAFGIRSRDAAGSTYKNNLISNLTANGGLTRCWYDTNLSTATHAANGADDTSSSDAGYDSLTITFTGGTDFSIASGSSTNVKTGGEDLGATANVDLTGRDRDSEGDTWSLGALQFVEAGGGLSIPVAMNHYTKNIG